MRVLVTHHPLLALKVGEEIERAIGRQELALDAVEESGVDMLLAGHNHHASSQDASDLVTRAGGVLVVQAGTATSTRVREQEQSFNTDRHRRRLRDDHRPRVERRALRGQRTRSRYACTTAGGCCEKRRAGALSLSVAGSARLDARMALPDNFDLDEFVRRVLAEDLGSGGDVTSNATIAGGRALHRRDECPAADRRRRDRDRGSLLPRARPATWKSNSWRTMATASRTARR